MDKVSVSKRSGVTIGASTSIAALGRYKDLDFLRGAIESFGSPAIRNMATVGGNLFVPRPAGDLAVCLVALGAMATISKGDKERREAVETLVTKGLRQGEIVTHISFLLPAPGTFKFRKVSRRALNSPSIITVAVVVPVVKGVVKGCRIALGAVVTKPARATHAEGLLEGKPLTVETVTLAAEAALADIDPAGDAHASAWYRARVTPVHIRRAILGE
jgi:CO/xanthine dehydrogenase FAD-binding subunit